MKRNLSFLLLLLIETSLNGQIQPYDTLEGTNFEGVIFGRVAFIDYDNDNDLDILITGFNNNFNSISKLYKNEGNGEYLELVPFNVSGVSSGSVAWGDYDSDGDFDLLIAGVSKSSRICGIYRNEGSGNFTEIAKSSFIGIYNGSVNWGDYDNDGDLDILLSGPKDENNFVLKLYRNDGTDIFTDLNEFNTIDRFNYSTSGDYDNDGDLDLMVTIQVRSGTDYAVLRVYRNDGNLTFTALPDMDIPEVYGNLMIQTGDYDNDNDLDILLSGVHGECSFYIFRNNGHDEFQEVKRNELSDVFNCSAFWLDYDNDGDLDIIKMGGDDNNETISKIFRNEGNENYTVLHDIDFSNSLRGTAAFADADDDSDLDLFIAGITRTDSRQSKIYLNKIDSVNTPPQIPGNLMVSIQQDTAFFKWDKSFDIETGAEGISYDLYLYNRSKKLFYSPCWADTATGFRRIPKKGEIQFSKNGHYIHKLPPGNYSWGVQAVDHGLYGSKFAVGPSFDIFCTIQSSEITCSDIENTNMHVTWHRGNGSACALFIKEGIDEAFPEDSVIYTAKNEYSKGSEIDTSGWYCVYNGVGNKTSIYGLKKNTNYTLQAFEYNMDSTHILFYFRSHAVNNPVVQKTGNFNDFRMTVTTDTSINGICDGALLWCDFDNDNDLDFMLSGHKTWTDYIAMIYRNDGDDQFNPVYNPDIVGTTNSSFACGDYDNDGDLDILLIGNQEKRSYIRDIYRNEGNNLFVLIDSADIEGSANGSVAWVDYDNDGDLDIYVSGAPIFEPQTRIYRNNGDNGFNELEGLGIPDVCVGSSDLGDYDNDGDLDVLITGQNFLGQNISAIYRNDNHDNFTELSNAGFPGVNYSAVAWGDYDNDGDLDFILSGEDDTEQEITKIYRNDGNDMFSELDDLSITGLSYSSVSWGDLDNDGDLDVALSGYNYYDFMFLIYRNDGNDLFKRVDSISIDAICPGSMSLGDYDKDGDLDAIVTNIRISDTLVSMLYKNETNFLNTPPSAPENLSVEFNGKTAYLKWDKATDSETPQDGLSYRIFIRSTSVNKLVTPLHADTLTGFNRLASKGKIQYNPQGYPIDVFEKVNCNWGVQAIDNGFAGSKFTTGTFSIFSIDQSIDEESIDIFPVPSKGTVYLVLSESLHGKTIPAYSIIDNKGNIIMDGKFHNLKTAELNLNGISSGMYYIVIQANENTVLRKIIIE